MSDKKKCAHPACECQASEGSDHCSNYCKAAASKDEKGDSCVCGHAACDTPHASAPR
jgi:metallothionein